MNELNPFDTSVNRNIVDMMNKAECPGMLATSPMMPMNVLDAAEVKADRCPVCHGEAHLEHIDSFRVCPRCSCCFKPFATEVYLVENNPEEIKNLTINEIMLKNTSIRQKLMATATDKKSNSRLLRKQ